MDRFTNGELDALIRLVCSQDGQMAGTTRPHPESILGKALVKLEAQREAQK